MGWRDTIKEDASVAPKKSSWRDSIKDEAPSGPSIPELDTRGLFDPAQRELIYGGNQERGLGELALEGTGKVLDYTGGLTRTGAASLLGSGGKDGQFLEAIKAKPISGQETLSQLGVDAPTQTQGLLTELVADPLAALTILKGMGAAAKAAPKLAKNLMGAAYKPAAQKLAKKGIDLGEGLLAQGFKGGSAKAASDFVKGATEKGLLAREGISAGAAQGALAPRAMPRASDIIAKAGAEAVDAADSRVIARMEKDLAKVAGTPKSLTELEQIKRGLNRKISDAARAPGNASTLQQQFWKGVVKDVDDEIIGRIAQGSVEDAAKYSSLGGSLRTNIKATPLLEDLANKPLLSQIDLALTGGGAIGAGYTDDPSWLAAVALKKAATNPYLLSKAATLVPKVAPAAGALGSAGAYGLLKQLTNKQE